MIKPNLIAMFSFYHWFIGITINRKLIEDASFSEQGRTNPLSHVQ